MLSLPNQLYKIRECYFTQPSHLIIMSVRPFFCYPRNVAKLSHIVSHQEMHVLIHAFLSSLLHHCNALYKGLSAAIIVCLQMVQNVAAKLLTRSSKYCHITSLLNDLH